LLAVKIKVSLTKETIGETPQEEEGSDEDESPD